MRAGAAEGLGRLRNANDRGRLETLWEEEKKIRARLSMAFAVVSLGRREISELSPLQYLINTLNHKAWKGVAQGFLKDEGYVANYKLTEDGNKKSIRIYLKYTPGNVPVISQIERVSRPGCRVYVGSKEVPRVLGGLGINILTYAMTH